MEHFPLVDRLHTDVLEEKYGKIHVHLLKHTKIVREAHLLDSQNISRTYSLTFFPKKRDVRIASVEKEIAQGMPIGKAFRNFGYAIRKNVIDVFTISLSPQLKKLFHTTEQKAKTRISEFLAKKRGQEPIIYGIVVEIYSPDFRPPLINAVDLSQENTFCFNLEKYGFTKDEIWRRIGNENYWGDVEEKYLLAKKDGVLLQKKLRKKVFDYLHLP